MYVYINDDVWVQYISFTLAPTPTEHFHQRYKSGNYIDEEKVYICIYINYSECWMLTEYKIEYVCMVNKTKVICLLDVNIKAIH